MITDAQIHLWEVDRPDRPWPTTPRNEPQLPNGFSAEQALAEMDAAGVDRAVIIPPTWIGENNATGLEAAAAYPQRFAVMGRFDATRPDIDEALDGWLSTPGMLGIRMTYRVPPFDSWLDGNTLDAFWNGCERNGIPVMNLIPLSGNKLTRIIEAHPNQTIIIDHMAVEIERKGAEAFRTINDLCALARYPNVYVKVSSAPNFSVEPYPFRDIWPFLKQIYDAFGPERLMWGSDLTRLASTYKECLDQWNGGMDFVSAEDAKLICGGNIARVLNWPENR
jgi:predicted TIM-barrel fold metal-dependent hydrolase